MVLVAVGDLLSWIGLVDHKDEPELFRPN